MSYIKRLFEDIQSDVEDLLIKYGAVDADEELVNEIASMVFEAGREGGNYE